MNATSTSSLFDSLPTEIIVKIALYLPDLPSLFYLDQASLNFAAVFNQYGPEIMGSVLAAGGQEQLPHQTITIIRLVAFLRKQRLKRTPDPPTINDFIHRHLEDSPASSAAFRPIPANQSPSAIRSVLAAATKISLLTSCCLAEHMRRCLALRPSHAVDTTWRGGPSEWTSFLAGPGVPYTPHSSGSPSWLERQRVVRAFWSLQLYLDMINATCVWRNIAVPQDADEDRSALGMETLERFTPGVASPREAIDTVVGYLQDEMGWELPRCRIDDLSEEPRAPFLLPWPPKGQQWQDFDWDSEGMGPFPGCADARYFNCVTVGNAALLDRPPGEGLLSKLWSWEHRFGRISSVFKDHFPLIFQRLGVAFWDRRRLMALELLGPERPGRPDRGLYDLLYTWKSVADGQDIRGRREHQAGIERD